MCMLWYIRDGIFSFMTFFSPQNSKGCGTLCFPPTTLSPLLPTYFISSPKQSNAEEINSTHNASPSRPRMERAMWG